MTEQSQSHFDGWAIVEVFGHQRYAGKVTTEAYGQAVMWRVDVPEIPERDEKIGYPTGSVEHYDGVVPIGSTVRMSAVDGYTKLFGTGAIYAVTPCTEEAARAAVLSMADRAPLKLVKLPDEQQALPELPDFRIPPVEDIYRDQHPELDAHEDDEVPY